MSTIEKALGLLEHFSGNQPEIGLTEFKALTGVDKGTLHRHLTSLKNCGFLEQNHSTKAYRLGPAVIRLSAVRERTVPIIRTVERYIDQMADTVHELVHAALPQKNGMSAIYARDGGFHATRVSFDEAEILPYHATSSGLAMLAFSDDIFVDAALSGQNAQFTENTATQMDDIKALITTTRAAGYAATNQTYEADVCSLAVPFFRHGGDAMGTLAIAAPSARMRSPLRAVCLTELMSASTSLCRDLGGQIPPYLANLWARHLET